MENTFNNLIGRSTAVKATTLGNPWEVIPIKNKKYARDTTEVHLANRGVQQLVEFENFPNLEVLWLNNNKLEKIEGLDSNFRIKHLYLQNNKIKSLEGSLKYLKHIETLILYDNELRDLDKNIEILQDYTHLTQLEIFGNPLAEEPNYRFRIIYHIPQLKLLDRHVITLDERQKAEKLMESDDYKKVKKVRKLRLPPSAIFSQSERDLYKEAAQIKKNRKLSEERKQQEEELAKTGKRIVFDPNRVPKSSISEEIEKRRKENPFSLITEWEKDRVKKIYKQFDKDKKGLVAVTALGDLYEELIQDKALIGKAPDATKEQFIQIIAGDKKDNINWDDFRFNLNMIIWTKPNDQLEKDRIKELYYKGNTKLNMGELKIAQEEFYKAIRLENAMGSLDQKPVFKRKKSLPDINNRHDSFNFARFTFRKENQTFDKVLMQILFI